jgi:hypothetical protein
VSEEYADTSLALGFGVQFRAEQEGAARLIASPFGVFPGS